MPYTEDKQINGLTAGTPTSDDLIVFFDNADGETKYSPISSIPVAGLLATARNNTGGTLYKGTIVYVSGGIGGNPTIAKARANSEATSSGTFGVVYADTPNNTNGQVLRVGKIDTLDTRTTATNPFTSVTLAEGDKLYLDPNTAGYVTNVKPVAPNHMVYLGTVTNVSPTTGTIEYSIVNGYELDEIHDVLITSKADGDFIVYENATSLWKNKSASTLGIITASSTNTLTNKTISGVNNTLTVDGTNTVGFREIPQNSQSTAYTLILSDSGKHIYHPSADTTARIWTIPANSSVPFPIGTAITFVNDTSAGTITIAITTDTLVLAGPGSTGSRTLTANGMATAIKVTSTRWVISGTNLS